MTTTQTTATPTTVRDSRGTYPVNTDGYCPAIGCYVAYNLRGELVTIPVD